MEELSLHDIVAIFKRRQKTFFITAVLVFVVAMAFALRWSNYRSSATVQIEQSYISSNVTAAAGINAGDAMVALADQRISQIEQKVTGLESLKEIILKYNLYPGEQESTPMAFLTERMRRKIKLDFVSSTISNPAAVMKQNVEQLSAIAFLLSFDYSDPQLTQQVVGELVTRFLDEDLKQRRTQAQETSAFLASQISQLETSMAEQEKAIAEFKSQHGESGATALLFNQQANVNMTMSIHTIESQLTANEGIQGNLRASLATIDPYSRVIADGQVLTTPAIQLKALQAQYASLSAQYGPDHPDVIKARNQINSLRSQVGKSPGTLADDAQLEAQIADTKTNLAATERTNGADHPDVTLLRRKLEGLEHKQANGFSRSSSYLKKDADNPAYLQVASQLAAAAEQHKALLEQKRALQEQQAKYEAMITANPSIDKEMARLTRDYENSQLRYRELKEKKMSADMLEQLETGRKGQRLVVINPPAVPEDTQPSRTLLMLAGLAVGILAGLTHVAVAEFLSQGIHGANHLAAIVGAMPLVTVPHMYTTHEKGSILRFSNMARILLRTMSEILLPLSWLFKKAKYAFTRQSPLASGQKGIDRNG